jgi:hypothetical protein
MYNKIKEWLYDLVVVVEPELIVSIFLIGVVVWLMLV